jgi:hypothetical protein
MSLDDILGNLRNMSIEELDILSNRILEIKREHDKTNENKIKLEEFNRRREERKFFKKEVEESPYLMLKDIGDSLYKTQNNWNIWEDNIFENIEKLKNDYVGKLGEKYINTICKQLDLDVTYVEDKNSKDGTYDIQINNKKIEIKTSRISKEGAFQHESLRNHGCDYYLFLDILPSKFYMTILPKFDLNNRCNIIGRTPHLRKGSSDIFKFDFNEKNIINAVNLQYGLEVSRNTNFSLLKSFLTKIIK